VKGMLFLSILTRKVLFSNCIVDSIDSCNNLPHGINTLAFYLLSSTLQDRSMHIQSRGGATFELVGAQTPTEIWKTTIRNKFSPCCRSNFHTYKRKAPPLVWSPLYRSLVSSKQV
jgi:hypothetical protein